MIALKAVLLCESIRVEVDGTLTLIGVYNERLVAPPGEGPIGVTGLAVLVVVSGLRGETRIEIGHAIRAVDVLAQRAELVAHEHDPSADEHNFIFPRPALVFAGTGNYALDIRVAVREHLLRATHAFSVERASA